MGASSSTAFQCSPRSTTTAAIAPAVPATMKLVPLQRNSSRQTVHADRCVDSAMAVATSAVLQTKYVAIAAISGLSSAAASNGPRCPPSAIQAAPVADIVTISAATLNAVR